MTLNSKVGGDMAEKASQMKASEFLRLALLRKFSQSQASSLPLPLGNYPLLPTQQPCDFLSWPWIKQKKLLEQYLRIKSDTRHAEDFKIDYSPLLWCDQARKEALNFLCEENHLVRVTIFAEKGKDLANSVILEPLEQLRIPVELFDDEMLTTLKHGVTVHIQLGDGCGKEQQTHATNCVYDRIFGFNKYAWTSYCQTLSTNAISVYPGMTIDIHPRLRSNFQDLVPDFLIHLSQARGAKNVRFVDMMSHPFFSKLASTMSSVPVHPKDWHDLLLGLIEESNHKATTEGFDTGYALLCRANTLAEAAMAHMNHLDMDPVHLMDALPFINGTAALCTKVFIKSAWAIHILVEDKPLESRYSPGMSHVFEKFYHLIRHARTWPGMSNRQLAGSLFVSGLFYEHFAAFLATLGNIEEVQNNPLLPDETDFTGHHKHAAHCYFAAAKTSPVRYSGPAMERWNAIYGVYSASLARETSEVKMETLSTQGGGEWYGWPVLWDSWGKHHLFDLERVRNKQVVTMSKNQVKRFRERLGIGNCRKEPAGLLRCLVGRV